MRIPSGVVDQYLYFIALDSTDYATRETGLSSFTVYRSRNGGAAAAMTSPTINETDSSNMPGVYELLLDEDMTIDSGDDTQEMVFHITHAGMAPVTRTIELYRPKITAGNTLSVESDGDLTKVNTLDGHTAQTGDSFARIGAAGAGLTEAGGTGDQLTAVPWNADWDTEVESEATDALNAYDPPTNAEMEARTLAAGSYFDAASDTVTVGTNNDKTDYSLSSAGIQAIWDALTSALTTAGSIGKLLVDNINAAISSRSSHSAADVWSSGTRTLTANTNLNDPTADAIADAVWDEGKAGHVGAGSFGEEVQAHALSSEVDALNDPTAAAIRAEIDSNSTQLAAIVADTNELQGDWANGGRLDLLLDQVISDIAALNDLSAAEVNAQVLDVLATDTFSEPTGVPPATATIVAKLGFVYMALRNRVDVTADTKSFYDDGGSVEFEKSLSDDGVTYSEGEANAP